MKTKAKLFALTGAGQQGDTLEGTPTIMHLNELVKNTELVRIGDESGFNVDDLTSSFVSHIDNDQKPLNIILYMHGEVENDNYYLLTKGRNWIESQNFIKKLVEATKGHPLKILTVSCFGANLQNNLDLLPTGSMLMTLSDKDQETFTKDYHSPSLTQLVHEKFTKDGFKIEHLLEAYLFAQKFINNTPIIGIRHTDSSEVLSMHDLAKKYFSNPNQETFKFSGFIENLFQNKIVSEEQLNMTINKVKLKEGDSTHLMCRDDMFSLLAKHAKTDSIKELIQTQEDNYYYPGSLSKFKLSMEKFDNNNIPEQLQNFGEVTLGYFCHLHKYLTENNIFESESQKEYLILREIDEMSEKQSNRFMELSQLPETKLCSDYRGLQSFLFGNNNVQLLAFEENNCKLEPSENYDWLSCMGHETDHIIPQSSVCMGAAFDLWLQDHCDL